MDAGEKAARVFKYLKDERWEAFTLTNLGESLSSSGNLAAALHTLNEAQTMLTRIGDRRWAAVCQLRMAECLLRLGQNDESMIAVDASRRTFVKLRDEYWCAQSDALTSTILSNLGEHKAAESTALSALEVIRQSGDAEAETAILARLADIYTASRHDD